MSSEGIQVVASRVGNQLAVEVGIERSHAASDKESEVFDTP